VKPARRRLFVELALVLLIGVAPIFFLGACTYQKCEEEPASPLPFVLLSSTTHRFFTTVAYATFVLAPMIAIARSGRPLSHFGIGFKGMADVKAGLLGFSVNYVAGWVIWIGYWLTGFPLGHESIAAFHYVHADSLAGMMSTWPWYVAVVIAEEQMARCYLMTRVREFSGSKITAGLVSSTLYALWHLFWGWAGAVHVFVAGLIFGVLFYRFGGAGAPAVGHWVFDALTLLPR
jgi:membrane protease YdiL (CAAX protease family)